MKKVVISVIVIVTLIVGITAVKAATVTEKKSYLNMGTGISYQGSTVKHTKPGIRFGINATSFSYNDIPHSLIMRLYRKNLIGSSYIMAKSTSLSTSYGSLTDFGNQGTGNYYYIFKTCPNLNTDGCSKNDEPYSGFNANPAIYYSYD